MSPRHQLIVSVSLVVAMVVIAWFLLFRSHVLAPPVTMPVGPTLPEIGQQFEEQAASLNKLIAPPPANVAPTNIPPSSTSSDDIRTPSVTEPVPSTP
ncbi:hypothetical protein HY634_02505 [Candidatus Uhrbacteria bacterium]|nr:hypothetical protein [Candidatus Uhrbacteria bacterium]